MILGRNTVNVGDGVIIAEVADSSLVRYLRAALRAALCLFNPSGRLHPKQSFKVLLLFGLDVEPKYLIRYICEALVHK